MQRKQSHRFRGRRCRCRSGPNSLATPPFGFAQQVAEWSPEQRCPAQTGLAGGRGHGTKGCAHIPRARLNPKAVSPSARGMGTTTEGRRAGDRGRAGNSLEEDRLKKRASQLCGAVTEAVTAKGEGGGRQSTVVTATKAVDRRWVPRPLPLWVDGASGCAMVVVGGVGLHPPGLGWGCLGAQCNADSVPEPSAQPPVAQHEAETKNSSSACGCAGRESAPQKPMRRKKCAWSRRGREGGIRLPGQPTKTELSPRAADAFVPSCPGRYFRRICA